MSVQQLPAIAIPLVNKFYDQHGARGRATKQDKVWVVRCSNDIIAAARVVDVAQNALLCGVYVAAHYRAKGVASTLIAQVCKELNAPLYSFIYAHLKDFYTRLAFVPVLEPLPQALAQKFTSYVQQGRDLIPYVYDKQNNV
ncbi:GNAT family N-acetyltransferase [Pseudoalteromonas sp. SSDWG2]|uniref:GNAT family N-acetyltransferase n=1 Tax=Pseudoalteromonas sp. SSDWG2 TaxID=3139391 RepID=UPI003BA87ED4